MSTEKPASGTSRSEDSRSDVCVRIRSQHHLRALSAGDSLLPRPSCRNRSVSSAMLADCCIQHGAGSGFGSVPSATITTLPRSLQRCLRRAGCCCEQDSAAWPHLQRQRCVCVCVFVCVCCLCPMSNKQPQVPTPLNTRVTQTVTHAQTHTKKALP